MCEISVIVPIFNGENTIEALVESLKLQSFDDFEAILISDGSTDSTDSICTKISEEDSRFRFIRKINRGVSDTRNVGLSESQGRWIVFADADDTLNENYLEDLYEDRIINGLAVHGLIKCDQYNNKTSVVLPDKINNLQNNFAALFYPDDLILTKGYPVSKIFDGNVIREHNLQFDPQIHYAEDLIFLLNYLRYCQEIRFSSKCNYNYLISNSIGSQKYNPFQSEEKLLNSFESTIEELLTIHGAKKIDVIQHYHALLIMRALISMYASKMQHLSACERYRNINRFREKYKTVIELHYNPSPIVLKIMRNLFLQSSILFDLFCSLKFK